MRIRKLRPSDKERVRSIIKRCGNLTADERVCAGELLRIYLNQPRQKDYHFVVAIDGKDDCLGYACYGKRPLTAAAFDLYWLLVDPLKRSIGAGGALLGHVEAALKKGRAQILIAETSSKDSYRPARRFYLKNGFRKSARIRDFYRKGEDLIIYVKAL